MKIEAITQAHAAVGRIGAYVTPARFAQDEIDFCRDVSARQDRFDLALTPYLKDVLDQWDYRGKGNREMVIMAPEQTGKSLGGWMLGLIWSLKYEPGLSLVVFPSDDKMHEVNQAKVMPLMRSVPTLAAALDQSFSFARNRYNLPGSIVYMQGAGERISAHSARICIADEVDDWLQSEDKKESPKLEDLRKRTRTFKDSLLVIVSSPKGSSPIIAPEFKKTSQGYWHLRCLGCGDLTMRSCDIHNLQFDSDPGEDERDPRRLIPGTERLVCPKCARAHLEVEAPAMNQSGAYVHTVPGLVGRRTGYQWGALASLWQSLSWSVIAESQLAASARASLREQTYFDNSIRGLPFKPRRIDAPVNTAILSHCAPAPAPESIEGVFLSADTQDSGWYWVARAVLKDESTALLGYGFAPTATDLVAALQADYHGMRPLMGIIDAGGHRGPEVDRFVAEHRNCLSYKGNPRIGKRQTISRENPRLLLCTPQSYQSELLYYIYSQGDRAKAYWYLPETVGEDYIRQIAAMKEPKRGRSDSFETWTATGPDHYFDAEKMCLALIERAKRTIPSKLWASGSPSWAKKARPTPKPRPARATGSWLYG